MLRRSAPLGCLQLGIVALALAGTMRCPVMPPGTMRRITAMSRHRDHLPGLASSLHFYGMPQAPARPLRDRGLSGRDRLTCTGREQLVKAAGQLAQAEFDHDNLAALVRRPHARARIGGAGDLDIQVLSAERLEPGTWSWLGGGTMPITAQYLVTAVIGVNGTSVTSRPESSRFPGYPRANTLREDSLAGSLAPDAIAACKAPSRGHRREAAAGVEPMRRSLPTPRGRRDSLRPDPADPAGALAAVIAEAAAASIPGPGGARCPRGPACPSPRSGRSS
jgi:hypothetical protein